MITGPISRFVHRITSGQFAAPDDWRERVVTAVGGFALEAGVEWLTIDNPMAEGVFSFSSRGGKPLAELEEILPNGLDGYHDGARVPLATGLGLLRVMLLRQGAWCRLHGDGGFFLHVGREGVYIGGGVAPEQAVARTTDHLLAAAPSH